MASPAPAAAEVPNGISTPPNNTQNASSPTTRQTPTGGTQPDGGPTPASTNGATANSVALPGQPTLSTNLSGKAKGPRDARLMHIVLASMGVSAYEQRVPLQLLDFAYRYTSGVLSDALAVSEGQPSGPGNKKSNDDSGISLHAVRQAVTSRLGYQFNAALPKEYMAELALERNRVALPKVEREFGIRLPPERYCLTGVGWNLKEEWDEEVEVEMEDEPQQAQNGEVAGATADEVMRDEDEAEDEFEEVMGVGEDQEMADG